MVWGRLARQGDGPAVERLGAAALGLSEVTGEGTFGSAVERHGGRSTDGTMLTSSGRLIRSSRSRAAQMRSPQGFTLAALRAS